MVAAHPDFGALLPDFGALCVPRGIESAPKSRWGPVPMVAWQDADGGERGLVASLVFNTSGTGEPRPVGSIPATSATAASDILYSWVQK